MADSIVTAKKCTLQSDGSVKCYEFRYSITLSNGDVKAFSTTVDASAMSDPNDQNEAKTKADAEATTAKTALEAEVSSRTNDIRITALEGTVTL